MEVDTRELLGQCWTTWNERVLGLAPASWASPTRCAGWTVHALAAHVAPNSETLGSLPDLVIDAEPAVDDAAALLRSFNAPHGVAHTLAAVVAPSASALAHTIAPDELARRFAAGAHVARTMPIPPTTVLSHPVV